MKTKKKSRFLTFCFSLIPGAGEMYMGFMKTGVSIMLLFALTMVLSIGINQGVLAIIGTVIWFYGFFHANHLASLKDEDFDQVKDEFLFGMDSMPGAKSFVEKYQKWIAYLLIFAGICFLWNSAASILGALLPDNFDFIVNMMWRIGDYVPSIVIAIAIIVIGIKLLTGKEVKLTQTAEPKQEELMQEANHGKADDQNS